MVYGALTPEPENLGLTPVTTNSSSFVDAVKNNDSYSLEEVLLDPSFEPSEDILNRALRFASGHGYVEILEVLCENSRKRADVDSQDEKGRSAAYIAARMGQLDCLEKLLELNANVNLKTAKTSQDSVVGQFDRQVKPAKHMDGSLWFQVPFDERGEMTPLHAAVRINSPECVLLLLENGGDVEAKDEKGMQAILHAGSWVKGRDEKEIEKYEKVLDLLLKYGADAKATYFKGSDDIPVSMSALRTAASLGSLVAVRELLEKEADPQWGEGFGSGRTALHEAAKGGYLDVLQLLLSYAENKKGYQKGQEEKGDQIRKWVNVKDYSGNIALHYAAISGSKGCISSLLRYGGNLGVENGARMTVMEAILIHILDAKEFICELLDSKVTCSRCSSDEPEQFKVTLDFEILVPNGKERRVEVVNSLITTRAVNDEICFGILDHPLVKAFINLEFSNNIRTLICLLSIYFMHVLALPLSFYFLVTGDEQARLGFQVFHMLTAIFVMWHVVHRFIINLRYYLFRFEIIFNGFGALCSIIGLIMFWTGLSDYWVTINLISTACLLQWVGFMSLCGLIPFLGTRALVFSDLFRNLWWTTASLIFVVIGYSLFFLIQFQASHDRFEDFFTSFESTVIMLIQDYQHGDIYSDASPPSKYSYFFRIMFVLFMFIGQMLVLNLLLSLTVSDRDLMIGKGKCRRLYRMIEFLDFVDNAPFCRKKRKDELPSTYTWYPHKVLKLNILFKCLASIFPNLHSQLPKKIEGELVSLALRNTNSNSIPS